MSISSENFMEYTKEYINSLPTALAKKNFEAQLKRENPETNQSWFDYIKDQFADYKGSFPRRGSLNKTLTRYYDWLVEKDSKTPKKDPTEGRLYSLDVYEELISDQAFGSNKDLMDYAVFVLNKHSIISQTANYDYESLVVSYFKLSNNSEVYSEGDEPSTATVTTSLEELIVASLGEIARDEDVSRLSKDEAWYAINKVYRNTLQIHL